MKKRYLYALLFGIPGFFIAGMIAILVVGGVMGVLWLFVFGDNPWPIFPDGVLSASLVLIFLILWSVSVISGYSLGRKLENDPALNGAHILISAGLTLLLILVIVLQQISVGNLGSKSEGARCSDFCLQKGYSASGTNLGESDDRTCTCFDNLGNEALKVQLDSIDPDASK